MFTTLLLPHLDELRGRSPLVETWHVAEGQLVRKGQALLVLSVDKATLEIQAAHGGTLRKRYVREGQRIAPGTALGVVGPATAILPVELQLSPTAMNDDDATALPPVAVRLPREGAPPMSPRARRRARELHVPLQAVKLPAGGGRISEKDVLRAAEALAQVQADTAVRQSAFEQGVDLRTLADRVGPDGAVTLDVLQRQRPSPLRVPAERVPLPALRRTVAEQATLAQQTIPQGSVQMVVRCDPLFAFREKLQKEWGKRETPTLDDCFLCAAGKVLGSERFRSFRALIDRTDLVTRGAANIAFTVPLDSGVTVSAVIHNVDQVTLRELLPLTRDLLQRARQRKLRSADLHGAQVSICNLSATSAASGTEIVRPGESAALLIPGPQLRPTVLPEGLIGFRTTWLLNLSYDRRLIDPALAADFLGEFKRLIEGPEALLGGA